MRLMRCLGALYSFAKREARTIARFLLVGGASFLVYLSVYTLQSRVLFPGATEQARVIMNLVATCFSVLFNYLAHRFWTYGAKEASIHQVAWYAFVVVTVTFLQTSLFWFGHVILGVYDYVVIVIVGGLCAGYTFTMHKYFTFRKTKSAVSAGRQE